MSTAGGIPPLDPSRTPIRRSGGPLPPSGGPKPPDQRDIVDEIQISQQARDLLGPHGEPPQQIADIPVRVYLSEPTNAEIAAVDSALRTILDSLDWDVDREYPPELASWFKWLICRTKGLFTKKQFTERAAKLERALELQALERPQAQADEPRLKGTAELLKAIGDNDAVVQIGSVLLVKRLGNDGRGKVAVRTLTQPEIVFLEKNTALFKTPTDILDALDAYSQSLAPTSGALPDHGYCQPHQRDSASALFPANVENDKAV